MSCGAPKQSGNESKRPEGRPSGQKTGSKALLDGLFTEPEALSLLQILSVHISVDPRFEQFDSADSYSAEDLSNGKTQVDNLPCRSDFTLQ
jgi:hypothetical protein